MQAVSGDGEGEERRELGVWGNHSFPRGYYPISDPPPSLPPSFLETLHATPVTTLQSPFPTRNPPLSRSLPALGWAVNNISNFQKSSFVGRTTSTSSCRLTRSSSSSLCCTPQLMVALPRSLARSFPALLPCLCLCCLPDSLPASTSA
eukprot:108139-Rhodomonas_salina.4